MKHTSLLLQGVAACLALLALPAAPLAAEAANPPDTAKFTEVPATREILAEVRKGGFVLYLRHGNTDNTKPDRVPTVDLDDCSTQRPLSAEGRRIAATVGEQLRATHLPIGEIQISPLCRVRDTAAAAFPRQQPVVNDHLMYTANLPAAQKAPIVEETRRLLSEPVAGGSNRLIIAHAPNLMDLIGYFPKEATLAIFRPKGKGDFDYVASIPPALWPVLHP
jgi:phosphohistidine phosphatase SixA